MLKRLGRRMGLERGSIGFGEKGFVYKGFFHSRKPGIGLTNTALEIPRDAKAFWKINEKGNMKVAKIRARSRKSLIKSLCAIVKIALISFIFLLLLFLYMLLQPILLRRVQVSP